MIEQLSTPLKIAASLPALLYGGLLLVAEHDIRFWAAVIAITVIGLLWLFSALDYPLGASWPAFVGVFLLVPCGLTLFQGMPDGSPVPVSHTNVELWAGIVLGGLYILWGVVTARNALTELY